MAFASSRIGLQEAIIKPCDLCEDDDDVNWFCKECVQYLCERCKKAHLKTAICKDHRIVTVLEGVAIIKRNISNACQDHGEHFTFYCRTCEDNICAICIAVVHKGHDFTDLRNLHSELQRTLENVIQKKEDEQMRMTNNIDELENFASHCRETLTKSYATIEDRMKAIHAAVDEEGGRLKETLKIAVHKQITEVEERQRKVEGIRNEYDEKINTVKQELTLQTTSTFGQFVEISTCKLQSLEPMTYSITMGTKLSAGRTSQELIMDMIGKTEGQLYVRESQKDLKKGEISNFSEIHIIQIHKLDVQKNRLCICSSPDGSIWIGGAGYVYKMSSDCRTTIYKIPTRKSCARIISLQSGDAVVRYDNSFSIDRFTSDGNRADFKSVNGSRNISVTSRDAVVVSVHEEHVFSKPTTSLFIYSKNGKQLSKLESNIFVSGLCINNSDEYVISDDNSDCLSQFDRIGDALKEESKSFLHDITDGLYGNISHKRKVKRSGCLFVLDRRGTVRKKIQTSKPYLWRMTCDKYGNILGIPDERGVKKVYLISDDGKIERSYPVECDVCINDICIDNDGRLLILVDYRRVIVAKYLE